jgi:hypothetical protein
VCRVHETHHHRPRMVCRARLDTLYLLDTPSNYGPEGAK